MEPFLNNLIKAIGWSIFHSLWQGAIIYGMLLLITIAVPRIKPRIKHNLAFAAICLIFISYCITFISVFKLPVPIETKHIAAFTAPYDQYRNAVPEKISSKAEYVFPYLSGIYGVGLVLQLLMLGMSYNRMLKLKKAVHFAVPAEWKVSFEKLVLQFSLHQHIGFYLSDKINVPLVIGYFKPVVLFPIGLASQLDMDQVEAILIHELSHIRRNDYLLNMIKTGIETLLFFNPFMWLSGKFIGIEREHACDDLVLKFTGNPMTYAHALLKLEILKDKSAPLFSMAATGKNQHLYQRIKRITDMKTNYMNIRQQMFTISLAIVTVISLAWIKPSKAENTAKVFQQKQKELAGFSLRQEPAPSHAPAAPEPPAAPKAPAAHIPKPPIPLPLSKHLAPAQAHPKTAVCQDTTKKKLKYTIITVDEKGNKKEYTSVKEMPESIRNEVISETFNNSHVNQQFNIRIDTIINNSLAFLRSPEWKKSMDEITAGAANIEHYLNSARWKKQQDEIRKKAESASIYFNSKEWKRQRENIRKNAEEMGKKAAEQQQQLLQKLEAEKKAMEKEAKEKNP